MIGAWSQRRVAIVLLVGMTTAACVSRRAEPLQTGSGLPSNTEVATSLVVEQFLRAANENDLDTMGNLFGTRDGPMRDRVPRDQLDQRLFSIASILRHDSFQIVSRQIVPGRRDEATQLTVRMQIGDRLVDVPYTLVYSRNGNWLIEQIEIERITSGRD